MREKQPGSSSCLKVAAIGCVILVGISIVGVGAAVYFIKTRGLHIAARGITLVTDKLIEEANLDTSEKEGVRKEISRFTSRLEAGEVSMNQINRLSDALEHGPLPSLLFLQAIAIGKVKPDGLSEEEFGEARLNAQRLQRASVEGEVSPKSLQEVFKAIPRDKRGEPKEDMTVEDWRPVMTLIKQKADDAGIPAEPYDLNLANEIRKLVDEVLATSS